MIEDGAVRRRYIPDLQVRGKGRVHNVERMTIGADICRLKLTIRRKRCLNNSVPTHNRSFAGAYGDETAEPSNKKVQITLAWRRVKHRGDRVRYRAQSICRAGLEIEYVRIHICDYLRIISRGDDNQSIRRRCDGLVNMLKCIWAWSRTNAHRPGRTRRRIAAVYCINIDGRRGAVGKARCDGHRIISHPIKRELARRNRLLSGNWK